MYTSCIILLDVGRHPLKSSCTLAKRNLRLDGVRLKSHTEDFALCYEKGTKMIQNLYYLTLYGLNFQLSDLKPALPTPFKSVTLVLLL